VGSEAVVDRGRDAMREHVHRIDDAAETRTVSRSGEALSVVVGVPPHGRSSHRSGHSAGRSN
jgi:hypothetical protein